MVTFVPAVSEANWTRNVPEGDAPEIIVASRNPGQEPVVEGSPPTAVKTAALLFPIALKKAVAEEVVLS